jgi:hypothetical protein
MKASLAVRSNSKTKWLILGQHHSPSCAPNYIFGVVFRVYNSYSAIDNFTLL